MKKSKLPESHFLPIVRDGIIAAGDTAEGRNIPILLLDCYDHDQVSNLFSIHRDSPPGDVTCTWGINKKYAFLLLVFKRPSQVEFGIKFDIESQGSLVDGIMQSCGLYIQSGRDGDTIASEFSKTKILVEVPPETRIPDWDKKWLESISKKMRKEGLSRKKANLASKEFLSRIREIWGFRMSK